jgi:hypothetical protein
MPVWPARAAQHKSAYGCRGPLGPAQAPATPQALLPFVPGRRIKCWLPASLTSSSSSMQLTSYLVGCDCPVIISHPPAAGLIRDGHEFLRSPLTAATPMGIVAQARAKRKGGLPTVLCFAKQKYPLTFTLRVKPAGVVVMVRSPVRRFPGQRSCSFEENPGRWQYNRKVTVRGPPRECRPDGAWRPLRTGRENRVDQFGLIRGEVACA